MQAKPTSIISPLIILNQMATMASGVWLAVLGEWWAIGYGMVWIFLAPVVLPFAMIPMGLFLFPANALLQKNKKYFAAPFLCLSILYIALLIYLACIFVFWFFILRASQESYLPLLIWSCGAALIPWMFMAERDHHRGTGGGETALLVSAQIAYITISLLYIFVEINNFGFGIIFAAIMGVGSIVQCGIAIALLNKYE